METWEKILLGVAGLIILLLFFPGVNRMIKESPKGTAEDWRGVLVPIGLVILFVLFLIWIV
jgi:hypothetical protein